MSIVETTEGVLLALGNGFLRHPASAGLRAALASGRLDAAAYYRQLLRLVYRRLFLHAAEAHALGLPPLDAALFAAAGCPDLEPAARANPDLLAALDALLDPDALGALHERLLAYQPVIQLDQDTPFALAPGGARKPSGAYYTPPALVSTLVEHALVPVIQERLRAAATPCARQAALLGLRVCDPAAGAGPFLLAAARRLGHELARVRAGSADPPPTTYRAAVRDVIRACLYGVDRDPLAVDLCKLALWLECASPDLLLGFLDHHVKCGDSLTGVAHPDALPPGPPAPAPTATARDITTAPTPPLDRFHWPLEFPEVMATGGFDLVLGNPPFANPIEAPTGRAPHESKGFRALYPAVARGAYDRANLFFARAVELLRPGGRLALLCPRATASGRGSQPLRAFLDRRAPPALIWCPARADLFAGASVYVCLVVGRVGVRRPTVQVSTDPSLTAPAFRAVPLPPEGAAYTWWQLVAGEDGRPAIAPPADLRLADVAAVWAGCSAGAAYELAPRITDRARGPGLKLLTTGAIDRFQARWGTAPIRYLGRDYQHPRWPTDDVRPAVARARDRQARPKLLVAGLSKVVEAVPDPRGDYAGVVSTFVVVPHVPAGDALYAPLPQAPDDAPLYALLAVLNSAIFSYLYLERYGAKQLSGGNCTMGKAELTSLPVPPDTPDLLRGQPPDAPLPAAWHERLGLATRPAAWQAAIALARRLSAAPPAADWSALDAHLHQLVSALYGLSPEQHDHAYLWWCGRMGARAAAPAP